MLERSPEHLGSLLVFSLAPLDLHIQHYSRLFQEHSGSDLELLFGILEALSAAQPLVNDQRKIRKLYAVPLLAALQVESMARLDPGLMLSRELS